MIVMSRLVSHRALSEGKVQKQKMSKHYEAEKEVVWELGMCN